MQVLAQAFVTARQQSLMLATAANLFKQVITMNSLEYQQSRTDNYNWLSKILIINDTYSLKGRSFLSK